MAVNIAWIRRLTGWLVMKVIVPELEHWFEEKLRRERITTVVSTIELLRSEGMLNGRRE